MKREEVGKKTRKFECTQYKVGWWELLRATNHFNSMRKSDLSAATLLAQKRIPFISGSIKIKGDSILWEEITGKFYKGEVIPLR